MPKWPKSAVFVFRLPLRHAFYFHAISQGTTADTDVVNTLLEALRPTQQCDGQARKVHKTATLLLVTLPSIHRFKKKISHTLSNKPFLVWSLTTPSHLKYVATLSCNLSLTACFADINVSQGSVATYARCGGMFNIHLTANLLFPVEEFCKSVKS